jgi:hypothetical protein
MQAQDLGQAMWGIGSRLAGTTAAEVAQAIEDRLILRTWPMRGTIHFVPAADAAWLLQVSAARTLAGAAPRLARRGLDAKILAQAHTVLRRALTGGARVTRARLLQILDDAGLSTDGQRGYSILWHAAQSGVLCFGPLAGKEQTFVLLEDWVPGATAYPRDDAVSELARRYFTSHGPATVNDFAWWAALTLADARKAVGSLGAAVTADRPAAKANRPRLLAGFDEYLLGYQNRSAVLPAAYAARIVPGNNGVFQPTMVRGGQVVGSWRRKVTATSVTVQLVPFERGADSLDAFAAEAERYAAFLGLSLSGVTVSDAHVKG